MEKVYKKIGAIGRFRPLHTGSANMLDALCECSEHVIIGIGSANRYNARSPFTAEETRVMLDLYLSQRFSNYEIICIDDFGHMHGFRDGQRWQEEILRKYGALDTFVAGNPYVADLLKESYTITHPSMIVAPEKQGKVSGTLVRREMAKGGNWKQYIPEVVAAHMREHSLVERFRREFGVQTLASSEEPEARSESIDAERAHITEE